MRRTRDDAGSHSSGVGPDRQPSDDSGFFGRWSQRKNSAGEDAGEDENVPDRQHPPGRATDALENDTREPEAGTDGASADNDPPQTVLASLDSLDADSDYSGFLSPEVDREIRRLALRKLFHLPSFNLRDGLDDYDDDFTQFAKLGDIVTRDMRYRMEVDARREAEKARAAAAAESQSDTAELASDNPDEVESDEGSAPLCAEGPTDTMLDTSHIASVGVDGPEVSGDPEPNSDLAKTRARPPGAAT